MGDPLGGPDPLQEMADGLAKERAALHKAEYDAMAAAKAHREEMAERKGVVREDCEDSLLANHVADVHAQARLLAIAPAFCRLHDYGADV